MRSDLCRTWSSTAIRCAFSVAAASLKKLGVTEVANMTGGSTAWKDAGLPSADHHAGLSGD
jgi:3-mercaptopyruvate sulfurtransferase SseA